MDRYSVQVQSLRQEINGHLSATTTGLLVAVTLCILLSAAGRITGDKALLVEAAFLAGSGAWFVALKDHMVHRVKEWLLIVEDWSKRQDHSSHVIDGPPDWESHKASLKSRVVMVPLLDIGAVSGVLAVLAINFGLVPVPTMWAAGAYLFAGTAAIPVGIKLAKW